MTKNKGGRPTVMTKGVVEKLLGLFSRGMDVTAACRIARIDPKTYYNKLKKDKGFSMDVEQSKEMFIALAHNTIYNAMEKGDARIAIEVLKRLRSDVWGDKVASKVEAEGIGFVVAKMPVPNS